MIHFTRVARNVLSIRARRNFMNNLMLSFAGADLSRLRTLVSDVEKEIALVPGATTATGQTPKSALDVSWSRLVEMLDLGTEPERRECPNCKHLCTLGASRCGRCWGSLPAHKGKEQLTA
jgi:hypothetical protein